MATGNPFAPTFGATPPVLAGRDHILEDIDDALATGHTHPAFTSLFIGTRGAGKTVMLNAVEDLARNRDWPTLSDNAAPAGMLRRLGRSASALLKDADRHRSDKQIKSVTAAGFGVEFAALASTETETPDLRSVLSDVGDLLAREGRGLFITLDELHSGDIGEIRELGAILQHVTRREQRSVAFAGAGLSQVEDLLLSDEVATFLQRCELYDIGPLNPEAVRAAIVGPIEQSGGSIDPEALRDAAAATSGFAFMVQLVGFHSWKAAADPRGGITVSEVSAGIAAAKQRIGRLVFAPTWRGLSDVDRRFLIAMAQDDGESRIVEIAARLRVDTKYASVYRHRLIKAGMISATGRGRINFTHHAARDWIRSEMAHNYADPYES